jgi:hypothetical protein
MAGAPKATTRRQFLAPFGDSEVPKGFAKNGDAIVASVQRGYTPAPARGSDFPPGYRDRHQLAGRGTVTLSVQGRNLTDKLYVSDYSNGLRRSQSRTVIGGVTIRF